MSRLSQSTTLDKPGPREAVGEAFGPEVDLEAPVTAVLTLRNGFALTTGDGRILFAARDLDAVEVVVGHEGAILCAAIAADGVLTGGDDGRVVRTVPSGGRTAMWTSGCKWIDRIAAREAGAVAWSCGKSVYWQASSAHPAELPHAGSIGGLAFAPKSDHLAVAHYGGVTIWDLARRPATHRLLAGRARTSASPGALTSASF